MEKTINCAECGKSFTYEAPTNYPDKRKYCTACSAAKKAQWENKDNVSPENQQIDAHNEAIAPIPSVRMDKDKSIVAQCLTKCWCNSSPVDISKEDVLEAYRFYLSEL